MKNPTLFIVLAMPFISAAQQIANGYEYLFVPARNYIDGKANETWRGGLIGLSILWILRDCRNPGQHI
jgi:hypothetical protein